MSESTPSANVAPVIAVTGATGFIGRHLVAALRRDGANVRALTRAPQPGEADNLPGTLSWVRGSLHDEPALRALVDGCDAVIHAGGAIKALSRAAFLADNAEGTARLAAVAAARPEPPRFILVSSLAAREPRLSAYAASKYQAEKTLKAHRGRMSYSIIRPPAVYGPGDRETLRLFAMVSRGFALVPPDREARFSMIHVDDLVGAILNLLPLREDPGQPLEVDDGRRTGHDWTGVVATAAEALRTRPRVIPMPAAALYLAGGVSSLIALARGRPSTLSWGKVPELLHPDWVAAGAEIDGWTPRWDLAKGFKNTVNWAISQGLLKSYS